MKNSTTTEPNWNKETTEADYQTELLRLLNWYRANKDRDDAEKYIRAYADSINHKVNVKNVPTTIGWLCRISKHNENSMSAQFDTSTITKAFDDSLTETNTDELIQSEKKVSVQDNIKKKLNMHLAEFDQAIDEIFSTGGMTSFCAADHLRHENVSYVLAKEIADTYEKKLLSELRLTYEEKDDQLLEAYSHVKKAKLKKIIEAIETLIRECEDWHLNAKQIAMNNRKPRKVKQKPLDEQVKKVKFLKEHEGVVGLRAEKIIGAKQLWVLDMKKKRLGVYHSADDVRGLQVKGTSIQNFDVKTSIAKTLRKTERAKEFQEMGKVSIRKEFQTLKSKEYLLNGRINENCLLLKIF